MAQHCSCQIHQPMPLCAKLLVSFDVVMFVPHMELVPDDLDRLNAGTYI